MSLLRHQRSVMPYSNFIRERGKEGILYIVPSLWTQSILALPSAILRLADSISVHIAIFPPVLGGYFRPRLQGRCRNYLQAMEHLKNSAERLICSFKTVAREVHRCRILWSERFLRNVWRRPDGARRRDSHFAYYIKTDYNF